MNPGEEFGAPSTPVKPIKRGRKAKAVVVPPPNPVNLVKADAPRTVILKNTLGQDVEEKDYFFGKDGNGKAPAGFNSSCGLPVEREDLVGVFNKIFKPEDNILFYKQKEKEVYVVIVPIKYSSIITVGNEPPEGDFQKHAISFINEGSVNLDTLKMKLSKIIPFIRYSDR